MQNGGTDLYANPPKIVGAPLLLISISAFTIFSVLQYLYGSYFWDPDSFTLGNDDAFITYRYAANLVDHGVVSFNVADSPPVEGYSNPLFLLLSALAYRLFGLDGVYPAMALTGVVATAVALVLIHRHVAARHGAAAAGFATLSLGLFPALWINATSGLETPLVFLAQVCVWLSLTGYLEGDRRRVVGLLAATAALVLLRTDGFTFPVFAALVLVLYGAFRTALLVIATSLALFLAQMGLRLQHYGLPMPLPYYVKVSGDHLTMGLRALRELAGMSLRSGFLLPVLGLVAATALFLRECRRRGLRGLRACPPDILLAAMVLAYYLMVGGDIYRERFLLIVIAIGVVRFWIVAADRLRRAQLGMVMAAVAAYLAASFWLDPRLHYRVEHPKYDRAVTLGRFLKQAHPDIVLATGTAGKPPYYSGLPTIDVLGLNDRHIAMTDARSDVPGHSKWDEGYVFGRRPGLICDHMFGDGGMPYGFSREAYAAHGYRPLYLVRSRDVAGADILRVDDLTPQAISALIATGYRYGCIATPEVVAKR